MENSSNRRFGLTRSTLNTFKLAVPPPTSKFSKLVCRPWPALATLKTLKLMEPLPSSKCSKLALRTGDQSRADAYVISSNQLAALRNLPRAPVVRAAGCGPLCGRTTLLTCTAPPPQGSRPLPEITLPSEPAPRKDQHPFQTTGPQGERKKPLPNMSIQKRLPLFEKDERQFTGGTPPANTRGP